MKAQMAFVGVSIAVVSLATITLSRTDTCSVPWLRCRAESTSLLPSITTHFSRAPLLSRPAPALSGPRPTGLSLNWLPVT